MPSKSLIFTTFLLSFFAISIKCATTITDNFDSLNTTIWGCEYACPTLSEGFARFNLNPGPLNTDTTWSKLSSKNKMLSYGTYSMKFRFNRRPIETETWAGWALYSATPSGLVNEINFGIETACLSRCSDKSIINESYKNSSHFEIVITTDASLFNGAWHVAELTYMTTSITLKLDGKPVSSIIDSTKIPTVPMALIPGARVVTGKLNAPFYMDVDSLSFSDSVPQTSSMQPKQQFKMSLLEKENTPMRLYNTKGEKISQNKKGEGQIYFEYKPNSPKISGK